MSEATSTQTLEQTLNKTDFGHVLFENRKIFFGIIIAILVAVTGFLAWKQTQHNSALNHSVKVFEFQSGIWADVKSGKTGIPELVKAFENLDTQVRTAPVMLPVVLEIGKYLSEKGSDAEAEAILSQYGASSKHPVGHFFVSMQRAVGLEKLGKLEEAVKVIEALAQAKDTIMPARVFLELGRLYKMQGEKGKAQTQFDHIVNTYPNEAEAKMAKLYLSELATK